jgi:hypothetical protein
MLALLTVACAVWDANDPRGFPTLLLTLPLAGVFYLWPVGRTAWAGSRRDRSCPRSITVSALAVGNWSTIREWRETGWQYERARIAAELGATGRRHLVIVRPVPAYPLRYEWVYNSADIDTAPVVWARDMGAETNARLLDYFRDRQVWLVEPDHWEVWRAPYPGRRESGSPSGG